MKSLYAEMLRALDAALHDATWLWRPMPFKEPRPQWCVDAPELAQACLKLTDPETTHLAANLAASGAFLARFWPAAQGLEVLCQVQKAADASLGPLRAHLRCDVPGRKWEQIEAFVRATGGSDLPGVEWCGGKGHLGRWVAAATGSAVRTLERDSGLCHEGSALARKAGVEQIFETQDVLALPNLERYGRHGVMALHACGDLHRRLVDLVTPASSAQVHLSPCCYHLTADSVCRSCLPGARLALSREDRRLAVTGTATASAREVRLRDREMAWKLGYVCLREDVLGPAPYVPIRSVAKSWLKLGFEHFCRALAAREGLSVAGVTQWGRYEQAGFGRQREVMRLSVVRLAFRRALEMWLVFDLALRLEAKGYDVAVNTFCEPRLTPRNILISARG